jgi:two-component system, sensor histidine kinase and response regulator
MVDKMATERDIDALQARITYLEENRRYTQNALELVLSLEDFYTEIGGDNYRLDTLLPEAKRRIDAIFPFDALGFYMVDESDFSFRPTYWYPHHLGDLIQEEVDHMIDEGYFAWAIRERRGVVIPSKNHSRQCLLHVIANHNAVKGMFGGLLPPDHGALPQTAMTLLSIILLHVANAADSMAYTSLLKNHSLVLERQVAERTKALTLSQQELELAMKRAKALAEEAHAASQAKGDFLARMSHELRTPLNGIIGMTEVALSTTLDDNQRRIIEIIGRESFSLLRQIDDVLDFSKIESGKLELESIDFDLRTLMEEIGETFIFQTSEKGVELNVFTHPDVPSGLVGDPVRLRQVLLNLTGNAVKFTRQGEILIEARLDQEPQPDNHAVVRFSIVDTGIGIEPQNIDRVFSSFTQADNSTTRHYGGTGLGTTISRQLVELMGGHIGVDSRPGKGSTFWFTVKFGVPSSQLQPPKAHGDHEDRPTLLVVDNSATTCRIMSAYLDHLGAAAVTATSGKAALDALTAKAGRHASFDLIITDARMPEMNGVALKALIRKMPPYAHTPIFVATSLKELVTGRDYISLGFDGCLSKPVHLDDLKAVLDGLRSGGASTESPAPMEAPDARDATRERSSVCGGRILVVDDYQTNQQVAFMHLTAVGFEVDLAENGRAAVEAFARNHYDLIFMDIQMPVLNGYDATARIREMEDDRRCRQRTPIIALTASAMKGDEQKCLDAGMDGYLIKPVPRLQLIKTAHHWIDLKSGHSSSSDRTRMPTTGDADVMDTVTAVEEFGDATTVKTIAGRLIENIDRQLRTIRESIAEEDRQRVRREAHAIKGGAATMEAAALSAAAARLEKHSARGSTVKLNAAAGDLEDQFRRFKTFISQWEGES